MKKRIFNTAAIMSLMFMLPQLFAQKSFPEFEGYYYANGERHYWETDSTSVNIIVKNRDHYDLIAKNLEWLFSKLMAI
jgi:hypothetical protein